MSAEIQRRWYDKMLADPVRAALYHERKRRNYKPRIPKVTIVKCARLLCEGTFERSWPNNNRKFCDPCIAFNRGDGGLGEYIREV